MSNSEFFKTIDLIITGTTLKYATPRSLADNLAEDALDEPMIVAWYDGIKKQEHPFVPECQHKPGWVAYAEGHNGKLQININQDEYRFIYADVNSDA
jgi:hypothetical protein